MISTKLAESPTAPHNFFAIPFHFLVLKLAFYFLHLTTLQDDFTFDRSVMSFALEFLVARPFPLCLVATIWPSPIIRKGKGTNAPVSQTDLEGLFVACLGVSHPTAEELEFV